MRDEPIRFVDQPRHDVRRYEITRLIRHDADFGGPVEGTAHFDRDKSGPDHMQTKGGDQSVVRFRYSRLDRRFCEKKRGPRGIEHGIVSAIAGPVAIARCEQQPG